MAKIARPGRGASPQCSGRGQLPFGLNVVAFTGQRSAGGVRLSLGLRPAVRGQVVRAAVSTSELPALPDDVIEAIMATSRSPWEHVRQGKVGSIDHQPLEIGIIDRAIRKTLSNTLILQRSIPAIANLPVPATWSLSRQSTPVRRSQGAASRSRPRPRADRLHYRDSPGKTG